MHRQVRKRPMAKINRLARSSNVRQRYTDRPLDPSQVSGCENHRSPDSDVWVALLLENRHLHLPGPASDVTSWSRKLSAWQRTSTRSLLLVQAASGKRPSPWPSSITVASRNNSAITGDSSVVTSSRLRVQTFSIDSPRSLVLVPKTLRT